MNSVISMPKTGLKSVEVITTLHSGIAYEPEETVICPIHNIEYYANGGDWCELCHPEMED